MKTRSNECSWPKDPPSRAWWSWAVLVLVVLLLVLSACSKKSLVIVPGGDDRASRDVVARLEKHYQTWRSVPYRQGGNNRKGIDCSGFVVETFHSQFGIQLPRSTDRLVEIGNEISFAVARPGDLIFFKTGLWTRHVGILLDRNRFLHASTSAGVTVSSLDEQYWQHRVWQVRRIAQ